MRRFRRFLVRNRTAISVCTVLLYLLVILPVSILLFPRSNLWLAMLLVFMGLLDEVKDLADQLVDDEEDQLEREGQR